MAVSWPRSLPVGTRWSVLVVVTIPCRERRVGRPGGRHVAGDWQGPSTVRPGQGRVEVSEELQTVGEPANLAPEVSGQFSVLVYVRAHSAV